MLPKNTPARLYVAIIVSETLYVQDCPVGCPSLSGSALFMGSSLTRSWRKLVMRASILLFDKEEEAAEAVDMFTIATK